MFADDCVLYTEGPNWQSIHLLMQEALNTYNKWGNRNYLGLNASKTKAMVLCTKEKLKTVVDPPF